MDLDQYIEEYSVKLQFLSGYRYQSIGDARGDGRPPHLQETCRVLAAVCDVVLLRGDGNGGFAFAAVDQAPFVDANADSYRADVSVGLDEISSLLAACAS